MLTKTFKIVFSAEEDLNFLLDEVKKHIISDIGNNANNPPYGITLHFYPQAESEAFLDTYLEGIGGKIKRNGGR